MLDEPPDGLLLGAVEAAWCASSDHRVRVRRFLGTIYPSPLFLPIAVALRVIHYALDLHASEVGKRVALVGFCDDLCLAETQWDRPQEAGFPRYEPLPPGKPRICSLWAAHSSPIETVPRGLCGLSVGARACFRQSAVFYLDVVAEKASRANDWTDFRCNSVVRDSGCKRRRVGMRLRREQVGRCNASAQSAGKELEDAYRRRSWISVRGSPDRTVRSGSGQDMGLGWVCLLSGVLVPPRRGVRCGVSLEKRRVFVGC